MRLTRSVLTGFTGLLLVAGGLAATTTPAAAANIDVKINEVESNGDINDWIELVNTGGTAVDISGWILKDSVNTNRYVVPAATTLAPGAYLTFDTDSPNSVAPDRFGLGGADSARVYLPDNTTLIDTYSWTTHAPTTYGRCGNGTGAFVATAPSTKGLPNSCATAPNTNAVIWPGGSAVAPVDPMNLTTENLSGLAYQPSGTAAPGTLWAVKNGNPSTLFKLQKNGSTWAPAPADWATGKTLDYPAGSTSAPGEPDAEGVALTDAGPAGGIFVATERNNDANTVSRPAIQRYDNVEAAGTNLVATRDYDLSADLPGLGSNLGLEGIAWVPDTYLTGSGFVDQNTGAAYNPATYAGHGTGLFFVGVEANGQIVAYALNETSNAFTRVAAFNSGIQSVMELSWEPETSSLWAVCDNTCQGRSSRLGVDTTDGSATKGRFVAKASYERPAGMGDLNNEGFATAPAAECSPTTFTKPVFWADDGDNGGFSLREGTLNCGNRPTPPVTPPTTPVTPPATAPVADTAKPTVRLKGVKNGRVYSSRSVRPKCRANDASGIASCKVRTKTRRINASLVLVTATAVAKDRAGNVSRTTKTYVTRR